MKTTLPLSALTALVPLFSLCSHADTVLYDSHGFEQPTFVPGNLHNQDNWLQSGAGGAANVIASGPFGNSSQVVQFDRTGGNYYAGQIVATPGNNSIFNVEWSMSYEDNSTADTYGPLFGVLVYDEQAGNPLLAAAAYIDAKTSEVIIQDPGTGFANITPNDDMVAPGTWVNFRLELDYATDTYDLFLNNNLIVNDAGFVDPGITGFHDVDFAGLAGSGDPGDDEATGTAYFDNLSVTQKTPDAGSTALLLSGALATLGVIRRKS